MANISENTQYLNTPIGGLPTANFSNIIKQLQQLQQTKQTQEPRLSTANQLKPFQPLGYSVFTPSAISDEGHSFPAPGQPLEKQISGTKHEVVPDYIKFLLPEGPDSFWKAPSDETKLRNWPSDLGGGQYYTDPTQGGELIKSGRELVTPTTRRTILGSLPSALYDIDHIIPLWAGGADTAANLQAINKADHQIKTAIQAVPLTLLANNIISLDEAKRMAFTWQDRSKDDIPKVKESGYVDLKEAQKFAKKWSKEESKPKISKFLRESITDEMGQFGKGFLPEPIREFAKGFTGGFTAGIMPGTEVSEDSSTFGKASNIGGHIAGTVLGIGKLAKVLSLGKSALTSKTALPSVKKALEMTGVGGKVRAEKVTHMLKTMGLLGLWGQLGLFGREVTGQQEFEFDQHVKQARMDLMFGAMLGGVGANVGGVFGAGGQSVKGYGAIGLGTFVLGVMEGEEVVPALQNSAIMMGLHVMGYKKGMIDPNIRYGNEAVYNTSARKINTWFGDTIPILQKGQMAPETFKIDIPKIETARIKHIRENPNDTRFIEPIKTEAEAFNFIDNIARKNLMSMFRKSEGKVPIEEFIKEAKSITAATNHLYNQTLTPEAKYIKEWKDLTSLGEKLEGGAIGSKQLRSTTNSSEILEKLPFNLPEVKFSKPSGQKYLEGEIVGTGYGVKIDRVAAETITNYYKRPQDFSKDIFIVRDPNVSRVLKLAQREGMDVGNPEHALRIFIKEKTPEGVVVRPMGYIAREQSYNLKRNPINKLYFDVIKRIQKLPIEKAKSRPELAEMLKQDKSQITVTKEIVDTLFKNPKTLKNMSDTQIMDFLKPRNIKKFDAKLNNETISKEMIAKNLDVLVAKPEMILPVGGAEPRIDPNNPFLTLKITERDWLRSTRLLESSKPPVAKDIQPDKLTATIKGIKERKQPVKLLKSGEGSLLKSGENYKKVLHASRTKQEINKETKNILGKWQEIKSKTSPALEISKRPNVTRVVPRKKTLSPKTTVKKPASEYAAQQYDKIVAKYPKANEYVEWKRNAENRVDWEKVSGESYKWNPKEPVWKMKIENAKKSDVLGWDEILNVVDPIRNPRWIKDHPHINQFLRENNITYKQAKEYAESDKTGYIRLPSELDKRFSKLTPRERTAVLQIEENLRQIPNIDSALKKWPEMKSKTSSGKEVKKNIVKDFVKQGKLSDKEAKPYLKIEKDIMRLNDEATIRHISAAEKDIQLQKIKELRTFLENKGLIKPSKKVSDAIKWAKDKRKTTLSVEESKMFENQMFNELVERFDYIKTPGKSAKADEKILKKAINNMKFSNPGVSVEDHSRIVRNIKNRGNLLVEDYIDNQYKNTDIFQPKIAGEKYKIEPRPDKKMYKTLDQQVAHKFHLQLDPTGKYLKLEKGQPVFTEGFKKTNNIKESPESFWGKPLKNELKFLDAEKVRINKEWKRYINQGKESQDPYTKAFTEMLDKGLQEKYGKKTGYSTHPWETSWTANAALKKLSDLLKGPSESTPYRRITAELSGSNKKIQKADEITRKKSEKTREEIQRIKDREAYEEHVARKIDTEFETPRRQDLIETIKVGASEINTIQDLTPYNLLGTRVLRQEARNDLISKYNKSKIGTKERRELFNEIKELSKDDPSFLKQMKITERLKKQELTKEDGVADAERLLKKIFTIKKNTPGFVNFEKIKQNILEKSISPKKDGEGGPYDGQGGPMGNLWEGVKNKLGWGPAVYNAPPTPKPQTYDVRGLKVTDKDLDEASKVIGLEISNRPGKDKFETHHIVNTAINRALENPKQWGQTLTEVLQAPAQYQAYAPHGVIDNTGKAIASRYQNLVKGTSDEIEKIKKVREYLEELKTQNFKDTTAGSVFYVHASDGTLWLGKTQEEAIGYANNHEKRNNLPKTPWGKAAGSPVQM